MPVRRTATWMQQVDDRILEYVDEEDWATPALLADEPEFRHASERRLRERMEWLVYAGLLAPIAGEVVEITGAGQRYLAGDLAARHQPRPAPGVPEALEA